MKYSTLTIVDNFTKVSIHLINDHKIIFSKKNHPDDGFWISVKDEDEFLHLEGTGLSGLYQDVSIPKSSIAYIEYFSS